MNSAVLLKVENNIDLRVTGLHAGGVGPIPYFFPKSSGFLKGKAGQN